MAKFPIIIALLLACGMAFANTNVSACGTLSTSNTAYDLNTSLSSSGTCLTMSANNSILDCHGYTLTGQNTTNSYGVAITAAYVNVTVKNCIIKDYDLGIGGGNAINTTVQNNTITLLGAANCYAISSGENTQVLGNTINTKGRGYSVGFKTGAVIDCQGKPQTGTSGGTGSSGNDGIFAQISNGATVKNCPFNNFGAAIEFSSTGSYGSWKFYNNTFNNSSNYGVILPAGSNNVSFFLNTFLGSKPYVQDLNGSNIYNTSSACWQNLATTISCMSQFSAGTDGASGWDVNSAVHDGDWTTKGSVSGNNATFSALFNIPATVRKTSNLGTLISSDDNDFGTLNKTNTIPSACARTDNTLNITVFADMTNDNLVYSCDSGTANITIFQEAYAPVYEIGINWSVRKEGNLWGNVLNNSVNITGNNQSVFSPYYIGNAGTGYPFNNSTSSGFFVCNFNGCADNAPLTSNGIINLTVNTTYGCTVIGSNSAASLGTNLPLNATPIAFHRFVNWTTNCNGTIANTTNANSTISITEGASCYVQARCTQTIPVNVSRGLVLGESSVANWSSYIALAWMLLSPDDVLEGSTYNDQSFGGAKIGDMLSRYNALSDKTSYDWVIVQIGLNDINPSSPSSNSTTQMQNLINTINAGKRAGVPVILSQSFPEKYGTYHAFGFNITGATAWQKENNMTADWMGFGTTPITGISYYITRHFGMMNDGNDSLRVEYQVGDYVHESNQARKIVGMAWRERLQEIGFLNTFNGNATFVSCGTNLNTSGEYYAINASQTFNTTSCFNITADFVTLDCQGYSITGNNSSGVPAIYTRNVSAIIKNCPFANASTGVFLNTTSTKNLAYWDNFSSSLGTYLNDTGSGVVAACLQPIPTDSLACSNIFNSSINLAPNLTSFNGTYNNATGANYWASSGNSTIDENASSFDTSNSSSDAYIEFRYFKTNANMTWNYYNNSTSASLNMTVPASCTSGTTVHLLTDTVSGTYNTTYFYCQNSTGWVPLGNFSSNRFFEQSVTWGITQMNSYNNTVSGHNEGNVWANVVSGAVQVTGSTASKGYPSLKIGNAGSGYPYSSSTSKGMFSCASGCADYAPLAPLSYEIDSGTLTGYSPFITGGFSPFWIGDVLRYRIPFDGTDLNSTNRTVVAYGKIKKIGVFNYGNSTATVTVNDESENLLYNISTSANTYTIYRGLADETYGKLRFLYSGNQSIVTADIKTFGD